MGQGMMIGVEYRFDVADRISVREREARTAPGSGPAIAAAFPALHVASPAPARAKAR